MRALNYVLLQKGLNEVHCDTTMQIQTGPGLAVTAGIITPAQLLPSLSQVRCSEHHHHGQGEGSNGKTEVLEKYKVQTTIQCIRHSRVTG